MAATGKFLTRLISAVETIANAIAAGTGRTLTFDPSSTFINTATADTRFTVGRTYIYGSKKFRYTQFKDAVAYAVGQPCFQDAAMDGSCTNDVSEAASATLPLVWGICLGAQTQDYYGFLQVRGSGTILHNNDDNSAIGSECYATVADGGVCDVATSGLNALFVGVGEVAVVAGTNLQQAYISIRASD